MKIVPILESYLLFGSIYTLLVSVKKIKNRLIKNHVHLRDTLIKLARNSNVAIPSLAIKSKAF